LHPTCGIDDAFPLTKGVPHDVENHTSILVDGRDRIGVFDCTGANFLNRHQQTVFLHLFEPGLAELDWRFIQRNCVQLITSAIIHLKIEHYMVITVETLRLIHAQSPDCV
jgi:hypothetical protein